MKEWCMKHWVLTFFIVISMIELIDHIIKYICYYQGV